MKPLISVIVPIYNVENYLEECLESLAKQTYPNLEIIMVNDGSTDNSETICKKYEHKLDNFYYFSKPNGGLSDARNYGLKKANGDYIGFVDSDDYVSPLFYQVLYEDLVNNDADISTCNFEMTDYKEVVTKSKNLNNRIKLFSQEKAIKYLFSDTDMFRNFAWNKLYKVKCFMNIEFPVGKKMEDLGTTYKTFLNSSKISYNMSKLYFYRQRKGSILNNVTPSFCRDMLALECERFIDLKNVYPEMSENDDYYLKVFLALFPFVKRNSVLWEKTKNAFYEISYKQTKIVILNKKDKLKYVLAKISPLLFWKFMQPIIKRKR